MDCRLRRRTDMELPVYDLDDFHRVQMNLLKKLDAVCRENGLACFLAFGTLLGAVREKRIIDWDDTLDVVMPWPDYEKLTHLPQEVWGEGLFLQTYETDPQYRQYFARLRDSRTAMIVADDADRDINHGIPINIYPLISLADDETERKKQFRNAKLYMLFTENHAARLHGWLMKLATSAAIALTSEKQKARLREKYKKEILAYEGRNTKDCFVLAGVRSLELALPKEWFRDPIPWQFEDMTALIPSGWNEWLTLRYGDYMQLPASDAQEERLRHILTISVDKPYTEYRGKTYCVGSR